LKFFGIPDPTLTWFRDGVPIVNNKDDVSYLIGVNSSTLSINDTNGLGGGHYTANASSTSGVTFKEFIIECKH